MPSRPLRSLNAVPEMKRLVNTAVSSIPRLLDVLAILGILSLIIGIVGVTLMDGIFYRRCRWLLVAYGGGVDFRQALVEVDVDQSWDGFGQLWGHSFAPGFGQRVRPPPRRRSDDGPGALTEQLRIELGQVRTEFGQAWPMSTKGLRIEVDRSCCMRTSTTPWPDSTEIERFRPHWGLLRPIVADVDQFLVEFDEVWKMPTKFGPNSAKIGAECVAGPKLGAVIDIVRKFGCA